MKTRADLINAVLENLGVLAAGQSPSAEDTALVDTRLDGALAELAARDVYPKGDPGEFEDDVFLALADACAPYCAPPFGVSQMMGLNIEQYRMQSESRLRRVVSAGSRDFPVQADYF